MAVACSTGALNTFATLASLVAKSTTRLYADMYCALGKLLRLKPPAAVFVVPLIASQPSVSNSVGS